MLGQWIVTPESKRSLPGSAASSRPKGHYLEYLQSTHVFPGLRASLGPVWRNWALCYGVPSAVTLLCNWHSDTEIFHYKGSVESGLSLLGGPPVLFTKTSLPCPCPWRLWTQWWMMARQQMVNLTRKWDRGKFWIPGTQSTFTIWNCSHFFMLLFLSQLPPGSEYLVCLLWTGFCSGVECHSIFYSDSSKRPSNLDLLSEGDCWVKADTVRDLSCLCSGNRIMSKVTFLPAIIWAACKSSEAVQQAQIRGAHWEG